MTGASTRTGIRVSVVARFLCGHRSPDGGVLRRFGEVCVPSSAAFGKVGDGYVAEVHRWAMANGIPVRRRRSFLQRHLMKPLQGSCASK